MTKKRTKRIFISDMHLSQPKPWVWFPYFDGSKRTDAHLNNLTAFIRWVGQQPDVKDLVLLGDVWDDWVWPANLRPPSIGQIVTAPFNTPFIDALNDLHDLGIQVLYVNGNHDMSVTPSILANVLPHAIHAGDTYTSRPIYAAHGHLQTMFNSPDPTQPRPLGYYLTRLLTKQDGHNVPERRVMLHSLDEVLEAAFTSLTVPSGLFQATMNETGATDDTEIVLPDGHTITCGQILQRYARTMEIRETQVGLRRTVEMVEGDLGHLAPAATRVADKHRFRVVVFGHSHERVLDKSELLTYDHIYANTDSWLRRDEQTFVVIDKSGDDVTVEERAWRGTDNPTELLSSAHIPPR